MKNIATNNVPFAEFIREEFIYKEIATQGFYPAKDLLSIGLQRRLNLYTANELNF